MIKVPPRNTGIVLQPRDLSLLRALLAARVITTKEAAEALFQGKRESAKKRLAALRAAGLIKRKLGRLTGASVISVTPAGIVALRSVRAGGGRSLPSEPRWRGALAHEAELMEVEAAFLEAARGMTPPWRCDFDAWPGGAAAPSFSVDGTLVRPDAFMRIEKGGLFGRSSESLFIEVDRSTERLETVAAKAEAYRALYGTGGFAALSGHPPSSRRSHPFRVLFIVPTEERRNNVAARLLRCRPPILRLAWLSTLEEVRRDPFGPIWMRPGDYRDAVHGTPYAGAPAPGRGYRTRPDRDRLVAERVVKQRVLP